MSIPPELAGAIPLIDRFQVYASIPNGVIHPMAIAISHPCSIVYITIDDHVVPLVVYKSVHFRAEALFC
jgi:hypothetical protein